MRNILPQAIESTLTDKTWTSLCLVNLFERNGKRLPEKDDCFTLKILIQIKDGWMSHLLPLQLKLRAQSTTQPYRTTDLCLRGGLSPREASSQARELVVQLDETRTDIVALKSVARIALTNEAFEGCVDDFLAITGAFYAKGKGEELVQASSLLRGQVILSALSGRQQVRGNEAGAASC